MAADLGGMAQWRADIRCTKMDSRGRRTLSGGLVASMAERHGKVDAKVDGSEDGSVQDGGDDT